MFGRRQGIWRTRLRQDGEGRARFGGGSGSAAVYREGDGAEQSLEGPASGEVNADTTCGLANASAHFEQLGAQGFDLCGTPRRGPMRAEEVDQVVGRAVQKQAEGIGQKAMTT